MSAGGNFDINNPPVRPGNYINFKAKKKIVKSSSIRGTVLIPLIGYDWGPNATLIKLTQDAPDAEQVIFGRSVYDDNDQMLLIRLALYNSYNVYVYITSGGTKATGTQGGLVATATYPGEHGNDITIRSEENTDGGFDIDVYISGNLVESYEGVESIESLIEQQSEDYVVFSGTGDLTEFAGLSLTGGANVPSTNSCVTDYLDKIETIKCNTAFVPITEESLQNAALSKINYLRNRCGKTVQFVIPNCEADNIGIIDVVNSFVFEGEELTVAQACAWVAGATAGASKTTSLTNHTVSGATKVIGELLGEEATQAIKDGKFFFSPSDEEGEVVVEYDINSLVNPSDDQDNTYKKNRTIRTFDNLADDLRANFPPNKFDNGETDWEIEEGLGRSIMQQYSDDGAIKDYDPENDFAVNRSLSEGDITVFDVHAKVQDSGEKMLMNVTTE